MPAEGKPLQPGFSCSFPLDGKNPTGRRTSDSRTRASWRRERCRRLIFTCKRPNERLINLPGDGVEAGCQSRDAVWRDAEASAGLDRSARVSTRVLLAGACDPPSFGRSGGAGRTRRRMEGYGRRLEGWSIGMEFEASMQSIMAASIAIEAFCAAIQTKAHLPQAIVDECQGETPAASGRNL